MSIELTLTITTYLTGSGCSAGLLVFGVVMLKLNLMQPSIVQSNTLFMVRSLQPAGPFQSAYLSAKYRVADLAA
jgi:hypothetical protein